MNSRRWRLEEVDGGDEQYPVESRFAVRHTSPDEQDPHFDRSAPTQVRFLHFVVRHISFRLFRPCRLAPDEHDAFRCLPMNTTTTMFLRSDPAMYTSPGHTYARVGVRDPARIYVRGRIYFLAHWPLYVRVHATCAPLLRHVHASTSTSIYVRTRSRAE